MFLFLKKIFLLGVAEDVNKFSRRLVKVTKQHNDDCKELLKLMGVPYVEVRVKKVEFVIIGSLYSKRLVYPA